jgi:hypothetical protein
MGEIHIRYKLNHTSDKNMKVQYRENTPGKYQSDNLTQESVCLNRIIIARQTNNGLYMNECEHFVFLPRCSANNRVDNQ